MMDDNLQYKIEQYLSGMMPPDEVVEFEKLIKEKPEVEKELTLFKEINHHLIGNREDYDIPDNEYSNELRSFLKGEESKEIKQGILKIGEEHTRNNRRPRRSSRLLIAASIASILFVSLGYWFFGNSSTEDLYLQYYTQEDLPSVIKRGDDHSLLEQGVLSFQDEQYRDAISYFNNYIKEQQDIDNVVYLYSGMSHLLMKHWELALQDFETMAQSNSLDASKGLWFKALVYLKMGDESKAKKQLQQITQSKSNFNYNKAVMLLKEL